MLLAVILMAWCKRSILITILWTGDSLQTRLSWVSKQFSFTIATPYLLFLLIIQCIIRSCMRTWKFWWKPLITINQMVNLWWPKGIALLLGLQQGFKKYCCFICELNSRAQSLHYSRKDWPSRKSLEPGIMNLENQPLVEPSKILLLSMNFKAWSDDKFCKGHEPRRSCLYLLMRKVHQTKRGKTERRCFHWSTNTRP